MLTEPSPLLSSSLNTLSACAVLVPPAPSAFSNSDLVIAPSPLASICENRSCSAPDRLLEAEVVDEVVDPVDDWLCAAISAFMVAGDICDAPVNPVVAVELAEAEAPGSWNGFSPDPLEGLE